MDLSFTPFDRDDELRQLPGGLAMLMVGVTQRQATSPTAVAQARLAAAAADDALFQPRHGAFSEAMAAAVERWKEE